MNSFQFRRLRARNRKQIAELAQQIDDAVIDQPKQYRPAVATDITRGNIFFYNVGQDTFFWIIVGDNVSTSKSFLDVNGRTFSITKAVVEEFIGEAELMASPANKPSQLKNAIEIFLELNPMITLDELAIVMNRKPEWIERTLGTGCVNCDKSTMPLVNLYALARVVKQGDDEDLWIDKAMVMDPVEFNGRMLVRLKELKNAKRDIT